MSHYEVISKIRQLSEEMAEKRGYKKMRVKDLDKRYDLMVKGIEARRKKALNGMSDESQWIVPRKE